MGIKDKLQFWKRSSEDSFSGSDDFSKDLDQSFTGSDAQNGFSDQGVTGQGNPGDIPPLDMSSQQDDQAFMDPNQAQQMPQSQQQDTNPYLQQQSGPSFPAQDPQSQQGMQQPDQVTMQTENGEKNIGRGLAEEYIRNSEQRENQNQQGVRRPPGTAQSQQGHTPSVEHSLELINVKLDSLKNAMDAISQRLLKLENDIEKERKRSW
ncbi:MAG: hypothetical protein ACOCZV_00065 [Nanoarchaeota archaeon]